MTSRTLAIGDIHGCFTALTTLWNVVQPQPQDQVITLGDYVDRGPDSRGVLDFLLGQMGRVRLFPLMGNHDIMMVNAWRDGDTKYWLEYGGDKTLLSYGRRGRSGTFIDVSDAHWDFLAEACAWYHETPTHIFVHAGVDPGAPMDEQIPLRLFWEKLQPAVAQPHDSGKTVICGHSSQKSGLPLDLGFITCIDSCVYCANGWLSCLDVDRRYVWQANEAGEVREFPLDDPPPPNPPDGDDAEKGDAEE